MILDMRGQPLRRSLGFVGGYQREAQTRTPLVSLIGFESALSDECAAEQAEQPQGEQ